MSNTLQKILIGGGAIGLLALGYFLFFRPSDFALDTGSANPLADSVFMKTQAFIDRRAKLEAVEIDSTLFSDPRFTTLRSYSTTLADEPLGKTSLFDLPTNLQPQKKTTN